MGHTLTIRLQPELAEWLEQESSKTGLSQGRIVREQLERAKAASGHRFMRLAGSVSGARHLSTLKGFSKR